VSEAAQSAEVLAHDLAPRGAEELAANIFRGELRTLFRSGLFRLGIALKAFGALFLGSHFATRWFAPFVYGFVHGHFANPWQAALDRGEPLSFPYGPGMLGLLSVFWAPAWFTSFNPASWFGLLLLRIPLFIADLTICLILMRLLRMHARDVVVTYWLNPIVAYATYVHGQLDLLPTALLCVALFLVFTRRTSWAGLVFGFGVATKLHLLVAFPFIVFFLHRARRGTRAWLSFSAIAAATAFALYAGPLCSPAFRLMVLGSAESRKLWSVTIQYASSATGPTLVLYLAPAALFTVFLRFASYRKVNRELTLMFLGALYVGLVALVPPQPGWFTWSIPFVAYLGARFTRAGRFALLALSSTYIVYFFVSDPVVFLESVDPLLGPGTGHRVADALTLIAPWVFGTHAASVAWTALFSAASLTAFEMYRKGVRSNAVYRFRDESFMIGIGGDSGAGKHTIGADLSLLVGSTLSLINGDDDHKWERGHAMWRRYSHLDPRGNLLAAQRESLAALRRGGDVRKRHYDHDKGRFTDALLIKPNDFVAIIGLHPFYLRSQRELFHLKVFVDTEESVRRAWKIARDVAKRGYSPDQVVAQIEQRTADSAKYVRPQARHADLVIRHSTGADRIPDACSMDIEMASELDPLAVVDLLEDLPGLTVVWEPDQELTRDRISIRGEIDATAARLFAAALVPNLEELIVDSHDGWKTGGRGLTQAIILHCMSVKLRLEAGAEGA
jgi:uridine kinase